MVDEKDLVALCPCFHGPEKGHVRTHSITHTQNFVIVSHFHADWGAQLDITHGAATRGASVFVNISAMQAQCKMC